MPRRLQSVTTLVAVLTAITAVSIAAQQGTPATPAAQAIFNDSRVGRVDLTFTAAQFAALAPRRVASGGSSESWLVGAEGERNGLSASRGMTFPYVHADVSIDGRTIKDIGVRYKGNGTFMLGQRVGKISMKLDFNQFVKGQKLGALKTVNLHSNVTDSSFMNEVLAFRLYRDAGVLAPRTSYVRVYVTVTGSRASSLYGLFSLVENPDEPFVAARGLPATGAIFKPVTSSLFRHLGDDWRRYNQVYDPKTDLTTAHQRRVIDFARLVTRGSDAEFAREASNYLDLDATARFMAATVWLADMDGILGSGQNYYLYLDPRSNRFSFMAWDQDHSFGQFFSGTQRDRERLNIHRPWREDNRFLERLFRVEAFKTRYLAHLATINAKLATPERLARQVDDLAVLIRPVIKEESAARLAKFEQAVSGHAPSPDDQMFRGATVPIKPFSVARSASVTAQLAQAGRTP